MGTHISKPFIVCSIFRSQRNCTSQNRVGSFNLQVSKKMHFPIFSQIALSNFVDSKGRTMAQGTLDISTRPGTHQHENMVAFRKVTFSIKRYFLNTSICTELMAFSVFELSLKMDQQTSPPPTPKSHFVLVRVSLAQLPNQMIHVSQPARLGISGKLPHLKNVQRFVHLIISKEGLS